MAKVGARLGTKVNTGNFENVTLDFWVEDDVRENEKVSEAFERVYKFVDGKLGEKVGNLQVEGE